jgi:hypothetical protein
MRPQLCRELNYMSLRRLAIYFGISESDVFKLYEELLGDNNFLSELNEMLTLGRNYFRNSIFKHESFDSIDWFAIQRIILYVLVRYFQPGVCLETGVFYGGTTTFILNALRRNNNGELISIDLPGQIISPEKRHSLVGDSENVPEQLQTGFIVHPNQKDRWEFIQGSSLDVIPGIDKTIDFYNHDSDHAYHFIRREMALVWSKLSDSAIIMADDIDWSNGFFSICVERKLLPLLITDNGKSELLVRTGIAWLEHPKRSIQNFTG